MAAGSAGITSRLESWISVGVVVLLSLASFAVAAATRNWSLLLIGFGCVSCIPSRYFSPAPLFRPLGRASLVSQVNASLSMPRWASVCDWVGLGLWVLYGVLRWAA